MVFSGAISKKFGDLKLDQTNGVKELELEKSGAEAFGGGAVLKKQVLKDVASKFLSLSGSVVRRMQSAERDYSSGQFEL